MKTLAELHEVLRTHPIDSPCREDLAGVHAELSAVIRQFAVTPDQDTLQLVNGLWANAWRKLKLCGRYTPTPGGKAGAQEKPKEAKVA